MPAATALHEHLSGVTELIQPLDHPSGYGGRREIRYERHGQVGVVTVDAYNGAWSSALCRRIGHAWLHATAQDTPVILLQAGDVFSNGIDLNTIEAAPRPAREAWDNIVAIDDLCRDIISAEQFVVAAIGGNAGAGGVMLALGADRIIARHGSVLNPHYATMGLFGSEYWTYSLPRRVGCDEAERLTTACRPIGAMRAVQLGSSTGSTMENTPISTAPPWPTRTSWPPVARSAHSSTPNASSASPTKSTGPWRAIESPSSR